MDTLCFIRIPLCILLISERFIGCGRKQVCHAFLVDYLFILLQIIILLPVGRLKFLTAIVLSYTFSHRQNTTSPRMATSEIKNRLEISKR